MHIAMTPRRDLTQAGQPDQPGLTDVGGVADGTRREGPGSLIGQVIGGNFRIERLIGSGATGNVYQAEQLSLGKAVAVKVLHPHLMGDDKLVRRFQREAKSAARLNHPNSVQIIESGQDSGGTLFIAMELLSGRDLAQVIRDEFPLPVPRMVHIMSQVFAALDEAHAHGLIHRDLKPSNIMLIERRDEPDFVKVCDYGIAKAVSEDSVAADAQMLTVQGLVCGTPEYMSPEQARGEPLDGRTDLYSAAVILYQMTTGDVPFRAATPIGIVSRHLSDEPALPSSRRGDGAIPRDLDDLILRGLAKSRELRPATAAIFREELHRVLTDGLARRAFANAQTLSLGSGPPGAARSNRPITPSATPVMPLPSARPSKKPLVIGLVGAALVLLTAVVISRHLAGPQLAGGPGVAELGPARAAATAPAGPAPAAPMPVVPAAPAAGPAPAPIAPPAEEKASDETVSNHDRPARRKQAAPHSAPRPARGATAASPEGAGEAAVVAPAPVAPAPAPEASPDDRAAPSPRSARDTIAEGEKLLAQGDAAQACRKGEEAKRAAPKAAPVYKFLGKCYMRAGSVAQAKDNYRRYLEIEPNAPDAVFIESMIK